MQHLFISILLLGSLSLYAQDTPVVVSESRDTNAIDARKWKEISALCAELKIPANPEANIDLLLFTIDWQGTPYCYGGSSKKCTDCSGFTSNAYKLVYEKNIPRVSRDIFANAMPIRKYALYQGDLVFFATAEGTRITHVGIYLWNGYFAHASSSQGVTVSNLRQGYYLKTFISGGAWIE